MMDHLQQFPALAGALIRLRGETLGQIARMTDIRTANLSVWLRNKPQVISEKRLVALMNHLGFVNGELRDDILHLWQDSAPLADLKLVVDATLSTHGPRVLIKSWQPTLEKIYFLFIGKVLIRIKVEPGLAASPKLEDLLRIDTVIDTMMLLEQVSTHSLEKVLFQLLEALRHADISQSHPLILESMVNKLREVEDANFVLRISHAEGWKRLEEVLSKVIKSGVPPNVIANLLDQHEFGGNANSTPTFE